MSSAVELTTAAAPARPAVVRRPLTRIDRAAMRGLRRVLARHRRAIWAVGALVLLALVLRTYNLASLPFGLWADESMSGLEILRILKEPSYRPIIGSGPSQGLPSYLWYLTTPFF